jgi:hypothetical protein
MGYEQLTALSSAKETTVPPGSRMAIINCDTQDVRWRDDDTAPTASVGMYLAAGVDLLYVGNLSSLQFIEVIASAKVNISYYG